MVGHKNELAFQSAWNACRKEQGSVKLTLNRKKLLPLILSYNGNNKKGANEIADEIIAHENELIEVFKRKGSSYDNSL